MSSNDDFMRLALAACAGAAAAMLATGAKGASSGGGGSAGSSEEALQKTIKSLESQLHDLQTPNIATTSEAKKTEVEMLTKQGLHKEGPKSTLQNWGDGVGAPTGDGEDLGEDERVSVTVRVPATTANLGPGFDTLGMALDIWNEMTVERSSEFQMIIEGEGASKLPCDQTNLCCVGLKAAFEAAGKEVPALKYTCNNKIPFARGLGSSSAAIVGGIVAGLVLAGHRMKVWGEEELLQIAADIEGHPDNVAPAIYGGIQLGVSVKENSKIRWMSGRVRCPDYLQCVLFIPDMTAETSEARALLADQISRKEAVFNIGRTAVLINALSQSNLDMLKFGTQDMLHQPQRGAVQSKHLFPLIEAAIAAGAHGCYLSGAGPTVLAISSGQVGDIYTQRKTERRDFTVAQAMQDAAAEINCSGRVFVCCPCQRGAYVVKAIPEYSSGRLQQFQG